MLVLFIRIPHTEEKFLSPISTNKEQELHMAFLHSSDSHELNNVCEKLHTEENIIFSLISANQKQKLYMVHMEWYETRFVCRGPHIGEIDFIFNFHQSEETRIAYGVHAFVRFIRNEECLWKTAHNYCIPNNK